MPDVVREGRRVVNNLERSGVFLVKNIFFFLMAILTIVLEYYLSIDTYTGFLISHVYN